MAALDTNVLVRFLVQDDVAQAAVARRLVRECVSSGQALFVPTSVVVELEWVLRSTFEFTKEQTLQTFTALLSSVELTFQDAGAVEVALLRYADGAADFSDCMHIALASQAGEQPLWTFDKNAAKVLGAQLLT
ncbi:MAG: type II toxin-antitoxin system VapC family toxin [Burkholderiaceae bacterium]